MQSWIQTPFLYGQVALLRCCVCVLLATGYAGTIKFSSCPRDWAKTVWAYDNPETIHFKDTSEQWYTMDRDSVCRWAITASGKGEKVQVSFHSMNLVPTEGRKLGDCIEVFDGTTEESDRLNDYGCHKPLGTYASSGRHLLVVYSRGVLPGDRSFAMDIVVKDEDNNDHLLRLAAILGGAVAGLGLLYLACRATRCCGGCKDDEPRPRHDSHEAECLAVITSDNPDRSGNNDVAATHGSGEESGQPNGATVIPDDADHTHSDSDSLQEEMNEPPPSYESLYLTEEGITPPKYSPPPHKARHPPRRVQTFN